MVTPPQQLVYLQLKEKIVKLDFNTVKGTPIGAVASAAICTHMNSNPEAADSIKLTDVDLSIQVDGYPIDMDQFKTVLETENSLAGFRETLSTLAERLTTLEATLNDCDSSNSAAEIFDAFWEALSNVSIDISDYVNVGVSQDDYYNSDLSYARTSVAEIRSDINRLLNRE